MLGMEMESFINGTISNTARKKRPKEARGLLVLLWLRQ
jgi:guanylate kinase